MVSDLFIAFRLLLVLIFVTGVAYPLGVYGIAEAVFPHEAHGSLIVKEGHVIGSALIAQKPFSGRYFYARPSASDYATLPAGASNQGPTSAILRENLSKRRSEHGGPVPAELLMTSGSGLDPHISPKAAQYQIAAVARERRLSVAQQTELQAMVERAVEEAQWGIFGRPRVNVLLLNLKLDERFP